MTSEQRLAVVGAELDTRLRGSDAGLTVQWLRYRSWSDCLGAMADAGPTAILGALPADANTDARLLAVLQQAHAPALVLLAQTEQLERALNLFQHGAYEYLPADVDNDTLLSTLNNALHRPQPGKPTPIDETPQASEWLGNSTATHELQRSLQQLSKVTVPVLLRGASGTGKRLFARMLHERSAYGPDEAIPGKPTLNDSTPSEPASREQDRSDWARPFVVVNVGALARTSIDVELFGLERSQNGDSQLVRRGRVEQAAGGTLYLDEVAELPLDTQARLAQLLADGQFYRVGGQAAQRVSLRIIAGTRHALESLVRNGQFQAELQHRLAVVQVQLPRLRERSEDIVPLAERFLAIVAAELGATPKQLAPDVLSVLQQYDWPGNVRQLENLCRQLAVMVSEPVIEAGHLPAEMHPDWMVASEARSWEQGLRAWAEQALAAGHRNLLDVAQPALERILLQAALKHTGGLKQDAAMLLGWGRNTLTRKLRELSIDVGEEDSL